MGVHVHVAKPVSPFLDAIGFKCALCPGQTPLVTSELFAGHLYSVNPMAL